jgi:hypothetical protein
MRAIAEITDLIPAATLGGASGFEPRTMSVCVDIDVFHSLKSVHHQPRRLILNLGNAELWDIISVILAANKSYEYAPRTHRLGANRRHCEDPVAHEGQNCGSVDTRETTVDGNVLIITRTTPVMPMSAGCVMMRDGYASAF